MDSRSICIATTKSFDGRATGKHCKMRFPVSPLQGSPSTQAAVLLVLFCFILIQDFVKKGEPKIFLANTFPHWMVLAFISVYSDTKQKALKVTE